jgi:hypothetical protein
MGPVRIGFYDTALSVNSQMSFVCSEVLYSTVAAVYVIRVVCIHNEECESIGVLGD